MTIQYMKGDIFKSEAQTIVNTVNCVGVMGKGLAKEFRNRFPDMFAAYKHACERGEVRQGRPFFFQGLLKNILCLPTKDNWKGKSKYEFIEAGLNAISANWRQWGITSLAIPPLGCGLGGLEWPQVKTLIGERLSDLPIDIEVYEPLGVDDRIPPSLRRPATTNRSLSRSEAYVGEIIRIARRTMPESARLGRLLVQKLAYFAQMHGAPFEFRFQRHMYGPYSDALRHILDRLDGLYVRDDSRTIEKSDLRILDEKEWLAATEHLRAELDTSTPTILSAALLFKDIDTQKAELLATVHYSWALLMTNGLTANEDEVIDYVLDWKAGKFQAKGIASAFQHLEKKGWLAPEPYDPTTMPISSSVQYESLPV